MSITVTVRDKRYSNHLSTRPATLRNWIAGKKLPVSDDGKFVRMVKATRGDGKAFRKYRPGYGHSSVPDVQYEVGKKVEAPDFQQTAYCGKGLHFAHDAAQAKSLSGVPATDYKTFVVDVDLDTAVVVDGNKIKAKFCNVLWEGTEKDFVPYVSKPHRWG